MSHNGESFNLEPAENTDEWRSSARFYLLVNESKIANLAWQHELFRFKLQDSGLGTALHRLPFSYDDTRMQLAAPIKTAEEDEEEINSVIASLACLFCSGCSFMIIGWHFSY